MKTQKNDLGKFAWFSRVTAPVLKLELQVRCSNLPKKDLLSQANGFCVLWKAPNGYTGSDADGTPTKEPNRKEVEMGRTEVSRACINPVFRQTFRLNFVFHQEQTFVLRVYDEDLRYATGLSEHDYLGGVIFTLGQVMGAKGCSLAKRLRSNESSLGDAFLVVTGKGVVENREVLEFRFSCQDLVQQHNMIIEKIDRTKVIDKCRPYFRLERLNQDDQSWEIVWKSEVKKQTLEPIWNEARLPLQLLCNDDQSNPLKITIWDYEKSSSSHVILGSVETSVTDIMEKSKDGGIPVFIVKRERQKLFRRSKMKHVGLLKVLNATIITVPSMIQYLSGGMSLDLMIGIDCSISNGEWGAENNLHFSANHWLNDYQAGIQKMGKITENFSRGSYSSLWGLGAEINGEYRDCYPMKERICTGKNLLKAYDDNVVNNPGFALGKEASLNPLVEAATFRTIKLSKKRPIYTVLAIFTAGDFEDLEETVDLICRAAEDAPISIVIIGVGNSDFTSVKQLCGEKNYKLRDSRGIPTAREIVTFVSFKQFGGNATEVIAEALKEIPEQFVEYQVINGVKPLPPVPAPNFEKMTSSAVHSRNKRNSKQSSLKKNESKRGDSSRTKSHNRKDSSRQNRNKFVGRK
mmetsp:Transcript_967/g.2212  ORF Transcript_967/g.2212 Transcript_967/m.2212 type:complete len:633 (+) Transcript_967:86-1984(+)